MNQLSNGFTGAELPRIMPASTAALKTPGERTTSLQRTILTVIDRYSRQIISIQEVADATAARALYRSLGEGWDAQIRTPQYTELILSF